MPANPGDGFDPGPEATQEGGSWIADLVFSAPPIVNEGLKLMALVAAIIVAYRVYKWGGVPLDAQREMQIIIAHIVAIITASLGVVNLLSLSYHYDVLVGVAAGSGFVFAMQTRFVQDLVPMSSSRERVAASWFILALAAMALPMVAASPGDGVQLVKVRFALAGLSTAFLAYNARILTNEQENTDELTGF